MISILSCIKSDTGDNAEVIAAALAIYTETFPIHERHPLPLVIERFLKGKNQLYTGQINNEIVFMALLWPLQQTDFILLDYMATHPAHHGEKIATHFLQHMRLMLQQSDKYFIVETEDPGYGYN